MRDFCSAAEMSRGHWNGDAEREGAGAGAAESLDAISFCRDGLLANAWRGQCFQRCAERAGPTLTAPAK